MMPSSWLETVTGALEAGERQFIFSEWVVNDEGVGASGAVILKIGVFTKANWDAILLPPASSPACWKQRIQYMLSVFLNPAGIKPSLIRMRQSGLV